MKNILFFLLLAFFSLSLPAVSYAQWAEVTGMYGGNVKTVASDSTTYYIGTSVGIFTSKNQGTTWERLNGTDNFDVSYIRFVKNLIVIYANLISSNDPFNSEGLYYSKDNGANWTFLSNTWSNNYDNAFLSKEGDLYYTDFNAINYTKDGGNTWKTKTINDSTAFALQITVNKDTIWAGTYDRLYRSVGVDTTWEVVLDTSVQHIFYDNNILYVQTDWNEILTSNNGGKSWK
ncbi:MAG: Photosynthesis system assembly factor, partial [Bacteroidota bacterium]